MTQSTEDRAALIAKLFAKAEAAGASESERDAYNEKATALMIKWGIEDAMLPRPTDRPAEKIIRKVLVFNVPKSYAHEYVVVGISAVEHLNCKGLVSRANGAPALLVVGYESDIANAERLLASLTIQCTLALGTWYADNVRPWMNGTDKYNIKRGFIAGFANGIGDKMAAWKKTAVADAAPGAELVLVDRRIQVDNWVDENMSIGKARGRSYRAGAAGAGWRAGQNANLGGTSINGGRKEIGR